jgi:hypothetical protein
MWADRGEIYQIGIDLFDPQHVASIPVSLFCCRKNAACW